MKYQSAKQLLPETLLKEIQKYVEGDLIYIPVKDNSKKKWGSKSGLRNELQNRNNKIKLEFQKGISIDDLAEKYYLSVSTIKNIVYRKQ